MHFSIEIETNCRETPKFSDLDEFLDLDRDFLVWTLMSRLNREISISTEISRSSRLTFEKNRRDYPSRQDWYFFVETNRDPQAYYIMHWTVNESLEFPNQIFKYSIDRYSLF